jgi:hypothetical protein
MGTGRETGEGEDEGGSTTSTVGRERVEVVSTRMVDGLGLGLGLGVGGELAATTTATSTGGGMDEL